MESDGLIRVREVGARSKSVYELAPAGRKRFADLKKEGRKLKEGFLQFQKLFVGIMGEDKAKAVSLIMDIRSAALEKNGRKVVRELEDCLERIRKI
jgi:DNA-binding PadR family transcriptional regulator